MFYLSLIKQKFIKMKKIIFIISILFSINSYSQYASGSFIVLNDGMEEEYIKTEKLWHVYHKKSVKDGHKNLWSIWKVDVTNYDDKIEKDRFPDYFILEGYDTLDDLTAESERYSPEGFKEISNYIKSKMKGKMSSRAIDKILSKPVRKETRMYHHQFLASTPFTGGGLKVGDKMTIAPMQQLQDDYEDFETNFYKDLFSKRVMNGDHRWWGFSKIINRNDNALNISTHTAWNMFIEGKNMEMPEDFSSRKIMEITPKARKMYNPIQLTLVFVAD
tara:strand:- start:1298 stop:2122 length:825 start_codon:yes stop_codon:yes gene_type:complete